MACHPDLRFQVLDDTWFADALEADLPLFDDWAARLVMGEDPLPPGVLDAQTQLLGKHFEALIAAWLDASPHFRLRAHGVQLQQDKQTVGELSEEELGAVLEDWGGFLLLAPDRDIYPR